MRTYLRDGETVADLFHAVENEGISYVVLRWFDELPHVDPGEDIDLLVADDDFGSFLALTDVRNRRGLPIDLNTPSGLENIPFNGIAVFPKKLSLLLLRDAVRNERGYSVPSSYGHFLSMAYHVVFHKGYSSGIPARGDDRPTLEAPDHDYRGVLASLNTELERPIDEISLSRLMSWLESEGFMPTSDNMQILVRRNNWLGEELRKQLDDVESPWRNLSVFIIREKGESFENVIRAELFRVGFHIISEVLLDKSERELLGSLVRGGNWGRGPFPTSGGLPSRVLVAIDPWPLAVDGRLAQKYPALSNFREHKAKLKIRKIANNALRPSEHANIIHSTDNAFSARECLKLVLGTSQIEEIEQDALRYLEAVRPPFPVLQEVASNARRARVDLVQVGESQLICKTFKPEHKVALEREILAREQLSHPGVIPIIDSGAYWFTMPHVDGFEIPKPLTPEQVLQVRRFMLDCLAVGIEPIDFSPRNLLVDQEGSLRFFDFEWFQKADVKKSLLGTLALYRGSSSHDFDLNMGYRENPFKQRWEAYLGIPRWLFVLGAPKLVILGMQQFFPFFIRTQRGAWNLSKMLFKVGRRSIKRMRSRFSFGRANE